MKTKHQYTSIRPVKLRGNDGTLLASSAKDARPSAYPLEANIADWEMRYMACNKIAQDELTLAS
jgi:hypothetical protein